MSDGAAHSTGKGESRIELEAAEFCRVRSRRSGLLESIELCGARGCRRSSSHRGGDKSEGNERVRREERRD